MTEFKGTIRKLQLSGLMAAMFLNNNSTPIFLQYGETENSSWQLLRDLKVGDEVELNGEIVELKSPKGIVSGFIVRSMKVA